MRDALTRADALCARTAQFRGRVARSRALIAQMLATARHPYVALSGGKDSLVTAALVREQAPATPSIWIDDELVYPGEPEYVRDLCAGFATPLIMLSGTSLHAEWFRPWSDSPFFRAPLSELAWKDNSVREWAPAHGYDGVFLGLRAEERAHRRIHLRAYGTLFFSRHDRCWHCSPLAWWSVGDVWAFIAEHDLPYSPVYDRLAQIGVPREAQRVGPLPLSPSWILAEGWPALCRDLVARYGRRWG